METNDTFDPRSITRPEPRLLAYYLLVAACTVLGFPFVFPVLYFKYHTLRYSFDDKGVSMSWGILFRREIFLTYRRIQDIHLTRNLFHRWLRLASVSVQTASGAAGAEMVIEGVDDPERLRDFLYAQMRGARGEAAPERGATGVDGDAPDEALALLREIRDELRVIAGRDPAEGPQ